MEQKGTEFLPLYIQMLIKYSGGYGFEQFCKQKFREVKMKVTVKKDDEVILERDDVRYVTDKGGAYEVVYEDYMAQAVYKDENIKLELSNQKFSEV